MLVNESRADEASLDMAMREAAAIWTTAGLRVVWTTPDAFRERAPYPGVFVVIRADFVHPRTEGYGASGHGRQVMGRVMSRDGLPTRMIEVSLNAVATSMADVDHDDGPRSRALVALARYQGPGRAIGRVIAHEIGHWLFGREHAPHGLMKATLHPQDLLEAKAPALPRGWNASEADRLGTLSWRCDEVM